MLLTQFLTGAPCQTIECDHDDPDETGQQNKENPALPVLHCASTNKKTSLTIKHAQLGGGGDVLCNSLISWN